MILTDLVWKKKIKIKKYHKSPLKIKINGQKKNILQLLTWIQIRPLILLDFRHLVRQEIPKAIQLPKCGKEFIFLWVKMLSPCVASSLLKSTPTEAQISRKITKLDGSKKFATLLQIEISKKTLLFEKGIICWILEFIWWLPSQC